MDYINLDFIVESEYWPGRIYHNIIIKLNPNLPITDEYNLDRLDEDLLAIQYPKNHILDVGWYPSHSTHGKFIIVVWDDDTDWHNPIFKRECKTLEDVKIILKELHGEILKRILS